jgi:hypothetical protein
VAAAGVVVHEAGVGDEQDGHGPATLPTPRSPGLGGGTRRRAATTVAT